MPHHKSAWTRGSYTNQEQGADMREVANHCLNQFPDGFTMFAMELWLLKGRQYPNHNGLFNDFHRRVKGRLLSFVRKFNQQANLILCWSRVQYFENDNYHYKVVMIINFDCTGYRERIQELIRKDWRFEVGDDATGTDASTVVWRKTMETETDYRPLVMPPVKAKRPATMVTAFTDTMLSLANQSHRQYLPERTRPYGFTRLAPAVFDNPRFRTALARTLNRKALPHGQA